MVAEENKKHGFLQLVWDCLRKKKERRINWSSNGWYDWILMVDRIKSFHHQSPSQGWSNYSSTSILQAFTKKKKKKKKKKNSNNISSSSSIIISSTAIILTIAWVLGIFLIPSPATAAYLVVKDQSY